jgi:hypothetical protein
MLIATTWEIEVELAHELYACNGDEEAFREDMRRLGFMPDEIDQHLERLLS